jgi:hypothetical protein
MTSHNITITITKKKRAKKESKIKRMRGISLLPFINKICQIEY